MGKAQDLFESICENTPGTKRSSMFGAPCLKTPNGKAAVCLYKDFLVVKPDPESLKDILALDGVGMFDPMDGRPMNGWAQVSLDYADRWQEFTNIAVDWVSKIPATKKK